MDISGRRLRGRRVGGIDVASSDPVSCEAAPAGGHCHSGEAAGWLRGMNMAMVSVRQRVTP